ncbi:TfuA-like protein [Seongchinamella unica]|uniref:TfuA-like protein n=1 Tax=Seongchinamella unica TaxID=2547392 RepID=UPI001EEF0E6B|nr:TfuA-like protein [Seongchinamella unica]
MNTLLFPPVVYAGPSISHEEIQQYLPGAQLMPPVARGDLYRDRTLGFSVFVILDGVFSQQLAIPPREVLDVLADGACVLGASSMGAIRAAECWPAGMHGVGTIYRLYRRGVLESDDEVALTFIEDAGYRVASVPLVNVRYSVSRHLRQGQLGPDHAHHIIEAARNTYYPDRNWRELLQQAGIDDRDGALRRSLAACDLKRLDAARALRRTARLLRDSPALSQAPGAGIGLTLPERESRERGHDATAGLDALTLKTHLWQWLLASGRYRQLSSLRGAVDIHNPDPACPDELWPTLLKDPAIDGLVFRYRAMTYARDRAGDISLSADERCLQHAQQIIARGHGLDDWREIGHRFTPGAPIWPMLQALRQDLAQAIAFRKLDHKQTR